MTPADYAQARAEEMERLNPTGTNVATWRAAVRAKFGYECAKCETAYASFPPSNLLMLNGGGIICLCRRCHVQIREGVPPCK